MTLVELQATLGDLGAAWHRLGGHACLQGQRTVDGTAKYLELETRELQRGDVAAASLGPDPTGKEAMQIVEMVMGRGATALLMEGPGSYSLEEPARRL